MTWSQGEIAEALTKMDGLLAGEDSLSLPIFEPELGIGVGSDSSGRACLLLPGHRDLPLFSTRALHFEPWCRVLWLEGNQTLPPSAVLRCTYDTADLDAVRIITAIFATLIDTQVNYLDAGRTILRIRDLFADGFDATPSQNVLVGLAGELLWISVQSNLDQAIESWHVDADDRYDFSSHSERLEVKTTTGSLRHHRFTSRQLPAAPGTRVRVVSVLLQVVADGVSIRDLYLEVGAKLSPSSMQKLSDSILDVTGLPASLLLEPQFDREGSLSSIRVFDSESVPTPQWGPGVSDIEWRAYLDELQSESW